MKRMMKKMSALFAGVLVIGTLAACAKFDASAYVKAILDNSYYNDPSGIVAQGIGTEEEASAIYEEGIDAQMDAMLTEVTISNELYDKHKKDDWYLDAEKAKKLGIIDEINNDSNGGIYNEQ